MCALVSVCGGEAKIKVTGLWYFLSSSQTAKKTKVDEGATASKVAPAKKPKAKKAAKAEGDGASASAKPKAKTAKGEKAAQGKAASADGDAPATKATGKRGKKAAE